MSNFLKPGKPMLEGSITEDEAKEDKYLSFLRQDAEEGLTQATERKKMVGYGDEYEVKSAEYYVALCTAMLELLSYQEIEEIDLPVGRRLYKLTTTSPWELRSHARHLLRLRGLYEPEKPEKEKATMSREDDYRVENATCKHATTKALLIEADEFDEPVWVPISQVSSDSDVLDVGDTGTLIVTGWLAEHKNWR